VKCPMPTETGGYKRPWGNCPEEDVRVYI